LKLLAGAGNRVDDEVLVDVGAAGKQGGGDGDANGAADVAHQVEEAAGVADLFRVECAIGGGADGNEDETETEAGDEDGEEQCGGGDLEGDVAEVESGEAEGEEAEGEKVAGIDLVGEVADDGHAADCADAARSDSETCSEGCVTEELLIEEREDGDGGIDADTEHEDENGAQAEVSVFEDF